jgi:hypothetical protein
MKDPAVSRNFRDWMNAELPRTFQELPHPLGKTAWLWDSEHARREAKVSGGTPVVMVGGSVADAVVTSISAVFVNCADKDSHHPDCGFMAKNVSGLFPVVDGANGDEWGFTAYCSIEKRSPRVLHFVALDYKGQSKPIGPDDIGCGAQDVASVQLQQPPAGTYHQYVDPLNKYMPGIFNAEWSKKMFEVGYAAMSEAIDLPMSKAGERLSMVELNMNERYKYWETPAEMELDNFYGKIRDKWWKDFNVGNVRKPIVLKDAHFTDEIMDAKN